MKKLRLLITKKCNRRCKGCCNNDWQLDKLPICTSFENYDEIILTGGEVMLFPNLVIDTINKIRIENPLAKIYMYTAFVFTTRIFEILTLLDGITVTLHTQSDVKKFKWFNELLFFTDKFLYKSLRLNIFDGIKMPKKINLDNWQVKKNIKWIKNCPLPADEVFMRLEKI
jgi:hypothetical protein